jgi:hypothetical protein
MRVRRKIVDLAIEGDPHGTAFIGAIGCSLSGGRRSMKESCQCPNTIRVAM